MSAGKIVIDDLREPRLTEAQERFLREAEENPVELTVDAVLAAARERAGLDDFGPDDFRERLGAILAEVDADENATALTRATYFNRLVGSATNRLLVLDTIRRHPEIEDEEIVRPIVIAGLPRSGTTHLLNLIAADTRLRAIPYWESLQPIPLPGEEPGPDGRDPRYVRCEQGWERLQLLTPTTAAFHPMDPEHIHEDLELQTPDFSSYQWEWWSYVPGWRDYLLSHDQTPHYAWAKRTLKILQWQSGEQKRWVLKCPQHFEQLRPVMNVYPDATVVFTHRDPVASLQSIVTQTAYRLRTREKRPDPDRAFAYWVDRVQRLLDAYLRDVELVPDEQRVDVLFDDLVRDDMATVERVYESAGLPLTEQARGELARFAEEHPRGKHGAIDHDLRRDFGVDPNELRDRFAAYVERVGLRPEVK